MEENNKITINIEMFTLWTLFSYDMLTYLPESVSMSMMKVAYYAVLLLCYLALFIKNTKHLQTFYYHWGFVSLPLTLFIWLYLCRMIYDIVVVGIQTEIVVNPSTLLFLFANGMLIPLYSSRLIRIDNICFKQLNIMLLCTYGAMAMASLFFIHTGKSDEYMFSDGRFMGNAHIDTIAFGHLGCSIIILSLALYRRRQNLLFTLALAAAVIVGTVCLFGAGSRGPMVALAVCLLVLLYAYGIGLKAFAIMAASLVLIIVLFPTINQIATENGNFALERLYNSLFSQNELDSGLSTGRDKLYRLGWEAFCDNPLLGKGFLLENGKYVHNCVLESFMACGIFGGLAFTVSLIYTTYAAFAIAKRDKRYLFLSMLYMQQLMYSLFSRTLALLPLFGITIFLVLNVYTHEHNLSKSDG